MTVLLSIDLPDQLADALERRARQVHSSLQELAVQAIEKDVAGLEAGGVGGRRVQLPLVHSENPGSLRSLTNSEIDALLGE